MHTVLTPEVIMLALAFGKLFAILGGICLLGFVLVLIQRHREIRLMHLMRKDIADHYSRCNEAIKKGTKI